MGRQEPAGWESVEGSKLTMPAGGVEAWEGGEGYCVVWTEVIVLFVFVNQLGHALQNCWVVELNLVSQK